jgi:hypothetical protein
MLSSSWATSSHVISARHAIFIFALRDFLQGLQTADKVEIDYIKPYLRSSGVKQGSVNRLANRAQTVSLPRAVPDAFAAYWVEIVVESDYLGYTVPMTVAGYAIFFFSSVAAVFVF